MGGAVTGPDFDVVVVGSRVAGAPTAMLLARAGLRVALVDRARFPSDAVSSHQLQVPGAAALGRWGLLDEIVAGAPQAAVDAVSLTVGDVTVTGRLPVVDGVGTLVSPRRVRLDQLLRDAAAAAGAELVEQFDVSGVATDGDRVTGIRGLGIRGPDPRRVDRVITARLVVGADGKWSRVAEAVSAPVQRTAPVLGFSTYSYWSGRAEPGAGGARARLFHLPGRAVAMFPTDDEQTVVFTSAPLAALVAARADPAGFVRATLAATPGLSAASRGLRLVGRIRLVPEVPNRVRVCHGPGWALVGDAGLCLDPVSAQGMTNAFLSVEWLVDAVVGAWRAGRALDAALADYQQTRDRRLGPVVDLTLELAKLSPQPRVATLLGLVRDDPEAIEGLLAVFAGVRDGREFLGPRSLRRLVGVRGLARLALS